MPKGMGYGKKMTGKKGGKGYNSGSTKKTGNKRKMGRTGTKSK